MVSFSLQHALSSGHSQRILESFLYQFKNLEFTKQIKILKQSLTKNGKIAKTGNTQVFPHKCNPTALYLKTLSGWDFESCSERSFFGNFLRLSIIIFFVSNFCLQNKQFMLIAISFQFQLEIRFWVSSRFLCLQETLKTFNYLT